MSAEALICRVGRLGLALPLAHVVEAQRPLPVQTPASAPAFVRGISVIRDEPVPVLRAGSRRVALTMDEVLGVRPFDASHQPELPALPSDSVSDVVSTIGTLDEGLLLALQAAFRLPESLWEDIESRQVERVAG